MPSLSACLLPNLAKGTPKALPSLTVTHAPPPQGLKGSLALPCHGSHAHISVHRSAWAVDLTPMCMISICHLPHSSGYFREPAAPIPLQQPTPTTTPGPLPNPKWPPRYAGYILTPKCQASLPTSPHGPTPSLRLPGPVDPTPLSRSS